MVGLAISIIPSREAIPISTRQATNGYAPQLRLTSRDLVAVLPEIPHRPTRRRHDFAEPPDRPAQPRSMTTTQPRQSDQARSASCDAQIRLNKNRQTPTQP